jgi:hypothetical protein
VPDQAVLHVEGVGVDRNLRAIRAGFAGVNREDVLVDPVVVAEAGDEHRRAELLGEVALRHVAPAPGEDADRGRGAYAVGVERGAHVTVPREPEALDRAVAEVQAARVGQALTAVWDPKLADLDPSLERRGDVEAEVQEAQAHAGARGYEVFPAVGKLEVELHVLVLAVQAQARLLHEQVETIVVAERIVDLLADGEPLHAAVRVQGELLVSDHFRRPELRGCEQRHDTQGDERALHDILLKNRRW